MLSRVLSGAVLGVDAYIVEVEVNITPSTLPYSNIVGLPEASVKESKERIKAAVMNSGYFFPNDRIIVNLAPANIRKEGTGFDLPMCIAIMASSGLIQSTILNEYLICGELSLDGRIKSVTGSLPMAIAAKKAGLKGMIVPEDNSREAAVVNGIDIIPVSQLYEVVKFCQKELEIKPKTVDLVSIFKFDPISENDFSDVQGQEDVKRAMEIAASGGHNLIMIGPPGSGKTMLAKRLPSILPPLSLDESIETTKIYSVAGMLEKNQALVTCRPFRSPHHTISDAGLIGGGHVPKPGEVSLAHNGVLFLDEIAEFKKNVLEVLRQPIEDKQVTISRAAISITYPSSFMIVAAMNPCPCGFQGDPVHKCQCNEQQIMRYRNKISGPLLDRIDIHIEVPAVAYKDLKLASASENSEKIRNRVTQARQVQQARFHNTNIYCNAQMNSKQIKKHCAIDETSHSLMEKAIEKLGLSARAVHRILKISRTIADLENKENIAPNHVGEAIQYRSLDRKPIVRYQ